MPVILLLQHKKFCNKARANGFNFLARAVGDNYSNFFNS